MIDYTLFLDDLRYPKTYDGDIAVARTANNAKAFIIEFGTPAVISFDHDLGVNQYGHELESGMDFMWWLVNSDMDEQKWLNIHDIQRIIIHSANPVGVANLVGLWDGYAAHKGLSVRAEVIPYG